MTVVLFLVFDWRRCRKVGVHRAPARSEIEPCIFIFTCIYKFIRLILVSGLVATICPEQRSVFILGFPGGWTVTRRLIPIAAPGLAPSRMSTRKRPEAFHVQSLVGDRQRKRTGPQHRRSGARIG